VLSLQIQNVKEFMGKLLKEDIFDHFEVRKVEIVSFMHFEINHIAAKEDFTTWAVLREYVFNIIKGAEAPTLIKIVFSKNDAENIHENAAALFLNFHYEAGEAYVTTGTAQKVFAMDKSVDHAWEDWVNAFFSKNKLL